MNIAVRLIGSGPPETSRNPLAMPSNARALMVAGGRYDIRSARTDQRSSPVDERACGARDEPARGPTASIRIPATIGPTNAVDNQARESDRFARG